jgi:hypothetical protein
MPKNLFKGSRDITLGKYTLQTKEYRVEVKLSGKVFQNDTIAAALSDAQEYGTPLSLPLILRRRIESFDDGGTIEKLFNVLSHRSWTEFDSDTSIWMWFTALSEEAVGIDRDGKFVERGEPVVITTHGDGILANPERIKKAYKEGLVYIGGNGAALTQQEIDSLLYENNINGREIKVLSYKEFLEESLKPYFLLDNCRIAIVRGLKDSIKSHSSSGFTLVESLLDNAEFAVYAGNREQGAQYIKMVDEKFSSETPLFTNKGRFGLWRTLNSVGNFYGPVDFYNFQPRGNFLVAADNRHKYGISSDNFLRSIGRFISVRPAAFEKFKKHVKDEPLDDKVKAALKQEGKFEDNGLLYTLIADKES